MKRISLESTFSDNLIVQSKFSSRMKGNERKHWWLGAGRTLVFGGFLCFIGFILVARLFQLTVVEGHQYRAYADDNRTRELVRHAARGKLLDRTGQPLVENIPRFRLLSPCLQKNDQLCSQNISSSDGEALQAKGLPAKNFLEVDFSRHYLYPTETAHVVGYTGEINDQELTEDYYTLRKYQRGDHVGRAGAEAVFEEKLRGRDGRELVEVDADGKILRVLGRDPEIAGEDVTLSLDAELSKVVAQAFPPGMKGTVIVSKPQTGEILAMYSSPTYSLNDFADGMSQTDYEKLLNDPQQPLFNRAIGGTYPPGSTYKIVMALAGLEEKAITKDTLIDDTGVITIGPFQFPNWYFVQYGKTEGEVDITKAIARSNDIYFYKTGESLGITKMMDWSKKVGLGSRLGIELPGEAEGLLPGPAWKRANFTSPADLQARQEEWYLGDTYHMAIGQGYLLTTPLQVNTWTNIVANGGDLCTPTIQRQTPGMSRTNGTCKSLKVKQQTLDLITTGMREACDAGGTAYPLFGFGIKRQSAGDTNQASGSAQLTRIPIACKTGTAEYGDSENKTHAWLTLFAPVPSQYVSDADRNSPNIVTGPPEISVTVLVEAGGEGSDAAAPIAKKILESWFGR